MKSVPTGTPALDDASVRAATRKSLPEWFAVLDAAGGPAKGRRALLQHVHALVDQDDWWATTLVVEYERARGVVEKDGRPKGYSLCATKTIAAGPDVVCAAWLDAGVLARWFGAQAEVQAEVGGTIANADGDRGVFTRIRPGKDLRIQWQDPRHGPGTEVEVLFQAKGQGKTTVLVNHTRIQERRQADALRATWGAALDGLKLLLESGTSADARPARQDRPRTK